MTQRKCSAGWEYAARLHAAHMTAALSAANYRGSLWGRTEKRRWETKRRAVDDKADEGRRTPMAVSNRRKTGSDHCLLSSPKEAQRRGFFLLPLFLMACLVALPAAACGKKTALWWTPSHVSLRPLLCPPPSPSPYSGRPIFQCVSSSKPSFWWLNPAFCFCYFSRRHTARRRWSSRLVTLVMLFDRLLKISPHGFFFVTTTPLLLCFSIIYQSYNELPKALRGQKNGPEQNIRLLFMNSWSFMRRPRHFVRTTNVAHLVCSVGVEMEHVQGIGEL